MKILSQDIVSTIENNQKYPTNSVSASTTHRQRILEKLDTDNSIGAIKYASAQGILN
jgi:hypothetical protein